MVIDSRHYFLFERPPINCELCGKYIKARAACVVLGRPPGSASSRSEIPDPLSPASHVYAIHPWLCVFQVGAYGTHPETLLAAASAVVVFGLWTCFLHFCPPAPTEPGPFSCCLFNWSRVFGCVFSPFFSFIFSSFVAGLLFVPCRRLWGFLRLFWCFDFYTLMLLLPSLLAGVIMLNFVFDHNYISFSFASVRQRSWVWALGAPERGLASFLWWFGKQIGIDWFLFRAMQTRRVKEITLRVLLVEVEVASTEGQPADGLRSGTFPLETCPENVWSALICGISHCRRQAVIINDTFRC